MNNDLERMWEVNNGNYPSPKPEEKGRDIWMREMFCTPGAMREYVAREGKWGREGRGASDPLGVETARWSPGGDAIAAAGRVELG